MATRQTRRRRRPRKRRALAGILFGAVALLALAAFAVGSVAYREFNSRLPPIDAVVEYQPPVTTQILAVDGTIIGEFFSERRYVVPLERIPLHVREAFLAAEDDAFYQHSGIDVLSIARALLNNLAAGGKVQGGSTITQQVVKSLLLTPKKSYERKLKEIVLSLRIERELSKAEILSLYLNHIYLGSGAYGVAAAGREYFGKDPEDLNVAEAAMLAGLPQAPSRYSPFQHWPRAKARQRYVLNRMHDAGFISREERDAALRQPLSLATRNKVFRAAPYFVEHVRQLLEERYGRTTLYELGLRVHTTVDLRMQRAAETALRKGIEQLTRRNDGYRSSLRDMEAVEREAYFKHQEHMLGGHALERSSIYEAVVTALRRGGARVHVGPFSGELIADPNGRGFPKLDLNDFVRVRVVDEDERPPRFVLASDPPVEGALIALNPHNGHVKAMVGGYDFERSQFNRAIQAKRQPGSAFKPLVFAAALDRDLTPASIVVDEPVTYDDHGREWSPRNFSEEHYGPTTLRDALTFSRNVVTVKLVDYIGVGYVVDYLPRFGLAGPFMRNLSIALGSAEVTPLEIAVAYATFANSGLRPEPVFVTEVTDPHGQVLEEHAPVSTRAIPETTAYLVTSMLQDVVSRGTGRSVRGLGHPTAGKTGTTNKLHDAWFVGYTPQLLATVWVGFDNKRPLGPKETGGRVAAPIWRAFMAEALAGSELSDFAVPEGLKCVHIDPATGIRALPGGEARLECFRAGTEPRLGSVPAVQLISGDQATEPSVLDFLRSDF